MYLTNQIRVWVRERRCLIRKACLFFILLLERYGTILSRGFSRSHEGTLIRKLASGGNILRSSVRTTGDCQPRRRWERQNATSIPAQPGARRQAAL